MKNAPEIFSGFCPVPPLPKERPRFTKSGHAYTSKATRQYEDEVRKWMIKNYGINTMPMDGPLIASYEFILPRPKTIPKKRKWSSTKPDVDNLTKAFQDALDFKQKYQNIQLGVIANDSRISHVSSSKRYAHIDEEPGTRFLIKHIGDSIIIYDDISPDILELFNTHIDIVHIDNITTYKYKKDITNIFLFLSDKILVSKVADICQHEFPNGDKLTII